MKLYSFDKVDLTDCYLKNKQELNRNVTVHAVYDRFEETGRFAAFNFDYKEGDEIKPHIFWDSDNAKWMESAAYILKKHRSAELEAKVDALVEKIKANQGEDGYFNVYFTVVEPEKRFTNRDKHELYCAGHMMEAAVAYADATGKTDLLDCMEKYADYIHKVFVEEKSAAFATPGHEEIELALIRMYRYTGKKKFLDLAAHFLNARGVVEEQINDEYNQTHLPVREQKEVVGHAVRAMYLCTGMAYLAAETGDGALLNACKAMWNDAVNRKMYITGGLGSTNIGEAFAKPYDMQNDLAYTETCAAIGLIFFSNAMLALEKNAQYADVIERALYNGVLSGLSLSGDSFFYENPLEINLRERFPETRLGKRKLPITERVKCFRCSCCPPNLTRLLATLGNYVYGMDGDTLYINQFFASKLSDGGVSCTLETAYPNDGAVKVTASGVKQVAIRIPGWCDSFTVNKPYRMENGYAIVENDSAIEVVFDMSPRAVYADPRILRDAGKLAVMRGPILYCAEGIDNGSELHSISVPASFTAKETFDEVYGLYTLELPAKRDLPFDGVLYQNRAPKIENTVLKMIPYQNFANRGESDMAVWFRIG